MQTFYHKQLSAGTLSSGMVVTIHDDGVDYRYHLIPRRERAAFKAFAIATFAGGMNSKRLVGRWPNFEVKQPT